MFDHAITAIIRTRVKKITEGCQKSSRQAETTYLNRQYYNLIFEFLPLSGKCILFYKHYKSKYRHAGEAEDECHRAR